jgi:O-antigen biosynthesis protein
MTDHQATTTTATDQPLEFTGERYTPEIHGNIELEHRHRYVMAGELVVGKTVLDIACGEGYGSAMLAEVARSVIGVDIAAEAIEHASERYTRGNLQFLTGSCTEIPMAGASVDVVVSFETIEHHDQHDEMLAEVKRVLRPDGVIIISTPDKLEYGAENNEPNPHHVKELTKAEFIEVLSRKFQNVSVYSQRVVYGSTIVQDRPSAFVNYVWQNGRLASKIGLLRTIYYIAMASDAALPLLGNSLFETVVQHVEPSVAEIAQKQAVAEAERVKGLLQKCDGSIAELNAHIAALSDSLTNSLKRLSATNTF